MDVDHGAAATLGAAPRGRDLDDLLTLLSDADDGGLADLQGAAVAEPRERVPPVGQVAIALDRLADLLGRLRSRRTLGRTPRLGLAGFDGLVESGESVVGRSLRLLRRFTVGLERLDRLIDGDRRRTQGSTHQAGLAQEGGDAAPGAHPGAADTAQPAAEIEHCIQAATGQADEVAHHGVGVLQQLVALDGRPQGSECTRHLDQRRDGRRKLPNQASGVAERRRQPAHHLLRGVLEGPLRPLELPRQRLAGRLGSPAELDLELVQDDLLGTHDVARLDHRLDLLALLLGEGDTDPPQGGEALDRVVERLAELHRRRGSIGPQLGGHVSGRLGGLVEDAVGADVLDVREGQQQRLGLRDRVVGLAAVVLDRSGQFLEMLLGDTGGTAGALEAGLDLRLHLGGVHDLLVAGARKHHQAAAQTGGQSRLGSAAEAAHASFGPVETAAEIALKRAVVEPQRGHQFRHREHHSPAFGKEAKKAPASAARSGRRACARELVKQR